MKKIISSILLVLLCINLLAISSVAAQPSEKLPVIIKFNGKIDAALIRAYGGDIKYEYTIISAIACSLPEQAIDALRRNPNIEQIEPDGKVYAIGETLDWGVDRIDAELVHPYNTGAGIKVAVIDTGIDYNHPDLTANYKGGYDFVNLDTDPFDDNGHGTHCAGIIAAIDNDIGVIGVAPNAYLYAVKILDSAGSGSESNLIAAIQWAVNNGIQIVSMSLGADGASSSLEAACKAAEDAGVLLVAAAGNDYRAIGRRELNTVDYPGRFDSVIAVGATDINNDKASFSSTGPDVEIAAPGVYILSTYPGGYAIASGTSMACPHVAGVAALIFASGVESASEVRTILQATADDLGNTGRDYWYGYGLVDADEAALPTVPLPNQAPVADAGLDQTVQLDSNSEVSVTFDGSGSDDTDGIIVDYDWKLGGITIGTGIDPTHIFTTTGSYDITLTVTDDEGATDSDIVTITVTPYQEPQPDTPIHVAQIDMDVVSKAGGRILSATATITIKDDLGNPVDGVLVTGDWTGATSDSDSGLTDSIGKVTIKSDSLKKPEGEQTFTFTVQTLSKDGCIYISASNVETEDSITYP